MGEEQRAGRGMTEMRGRWENCGLDKNKYIEKKLSGIKTKGLCVAVLFM